MLILLDGRPLQKADTANETTWFLITCAKELTARHGVEWIFLLDKTGRRLSLPADGRQLVYKTLPGGLGDRLWYGWLLPKVAKQCGVDLVMTGGMEGRTPGIRGMKTPFCSWRMSQKGLIFSFNGTDVRVPLAPDEEVRALAMEERENIKKEIAGGREYFFADVTGVAALEVMNLLKAFSLFKKRQLSNMKLVLAGIGAIDKLDSYKYREDVCLYPERTKGSMEAAYAVIHMLHRGDPGFAILNAWRAKTSVIVLSDGGLPDWAGVLDGRPAGDAVLQAPVDDIEALAEGLKSLYKNEIVRNELIEKGALRVADLSVPQSAAVIGGFLGNVRSQRTPGSFGGEN